jgi:hypothetical protein
MNDAHDTERLFVARCSLVLFVAGLLVPLIIGVVVLALSQPSFSQRAEATAAFLALGFGLIAEVLALVLGIAGRRHLSGKIGMIGAITIIVMALGTLGLKLVPGYKEPQPVGEAIEASAQPVTATSSASSPAAPPTAAAKGPAAEEPHYQFTQEESESLKRMMGVDYLWRYQGGTPQIHVQYFIDYIEGGVWKEDTPPTDKTGGPPVPRFPSKHIVGGVKKRAFLQAFNIGPARGAGAFPHWYCDVAQSEGVFTLDNKALRSLHQFSANDPLHPMRFGRNETSRFGKPRPLHITWDPLDWGKQLSTEPKETLIFEFDKVQASSCYLYWEPNFWGTELGMGIRGTAQSGEWFRFHKSSEAEATYAGQPGHAMLSVVIVGQKKKAPATVEECDAEVVRLRKQSAANPEDARLKWDLAWAIEYQRVLRKQKLSWRSYVFPAGYPADEKLRLVPTDYPADETVQLVREASRQVPGNMFYRAELRRLLFRQAWFSPDELHGPKPSKPPPPRLPVFGPKFPELFQEIVSLVPLDNSEHLEAARLLASWKNTVLWTNSAKDKKKPLFQEADAKIVQLLRRHAGAWQKHPDEIHKKLEAYEKDAKGQSYGETPQFKELLAQMREWAKKAGEKPK